MLLKILGYYFYSIFLFYFFLWVFLELYVHKYHLLKNYLCVLHVCVFVCVHSFLCVNLDICAMVYLWRSEDNLGFCLFDFYLVMRQKFSCFPAAYAWIPMPRYLCLDTVPGYLCLDTRV